MKRFLSFFIMITMLLGTLSAISSCKKDDTDSGTTGDVAISDNWDGNIVTEGISDCAIVLGKYASPAIKDAAAELAGAIESTTGVRLPTITDERALEYGNEYRYIIIGSTSLDQYSKAAETLTDGTDAYRVEAVDGAMVFASALDSGVCAAVDFYTDNLIQKNFHVDSNTLKFEPCQADATTTFSTGFKLSEIEKYSIVYSTAVPGFELIVPEIAKAIKDTTGADLDVFADTEKAESEYEILVGFTNRNVSKRHYGDSKIMTYEFIVDGAALQIAAGGAYSAKNCISDLKANVLSRSDATLAPGSYGSKDLAPTREKLSEGADLRIFTANLLSDLNTDESWLAVPYRFEIFCGNLLRYTPDAVGMQEIDAPFVKVIPSFLGVIDYLDGIDYEYILGTYNGYDQWEPIIYRADKYECEYAKYVPMEYWDKITLYYRGVASAVFSSRENPDFKFGIVNAHWNHTSADYMNADSMAMADTFNNLANRYPGVHLFCTGDFNSHYFNGKYLDNLLDDIDGAICRVVAIENGVFTPSFTHQNKYIDHIIGEAGTFDVLKHAPVENGEKPLTDHGVVYADIKIID